MKTKTMFRLSIVIALVGALLLVAVWRQDTTPTSNGNVIKLQPPPFVGVAHAAPASAPTGIIEDEAGISAYFKAPSTINLNTAKAVYRTIEVTTTNYLIGSVALAGYLDWEDVHVYIHKDGWVLAYYLKADPSGKIFDWNAYNGGTSINTKLEIALANVASVIGAPAPVATFYHFQYPNATNMLLIAERGDNGNAFSVQLPSSFSFYERSWSHSNGWFKLNGTEIHRGNGLWYGILTASQLSPDTPHWIETEAYYDCCKAGLALIYR